MKPLSFLLAFLICGLSLLAAKPIDLPREQMHLDIPDAWTSSSSGGGLIFSATDAQSTAAVNLVRMHNDRGYGMDDPTFVNGIKEGFINKVKSQGLNVTISQEGPITLHGVPFYNFQGTLVAADGLTTNFHLYVTAANEQIYTLSLQSARPETEVAVQGVANSLSFTTPPVVPKAYELRNKIETIGYYVGMFIGLLAVISIIKWMQVRARRRAAAN